MFNAIIYGLSILSEVEKSLVSLSGRVVEKKVSKNSIEVDQMKIVRIKNVNARRMECSFMQ